MCGLKDGRVADHGHRLDSGIYMRLLLIATLVCSVVSTLVAGAGPARAAVSTHVVSESNGEIVLRFVNEGSTQVPVARFLVAIANEGNFSVTANAGTPVKLLEPPRFAGGEPIDSVRARLALREDTLRVWTPFTYRGQRVIYVEFEMFVFPAGTNEIFQFASPTVTVRYDPAPLTNNRQTVDPFLRRLVANDDIFPSIARTSSTDPWFSLASAWVRIPVPTRGVYVVTGADLAALGVNPGSINDPSSIRVYSQFGQPQPRDMAEAGGSWRAGYAMEELAILVEDGGDGTFDVSDRVVFYGVAASDWTDYFDPTAPDTVYQDHPRSDINYYYLTWDGALPGTPARIASIDGSPGAPGNDVTTYVERYYGERDRVADFDFLGDGWLWLQVAEKGEKRFTLETRDITNLDTSQPQTFRTLAVANYRSPNFTKPIPDPPNLNDHWARYLVRRGGVSSPITEVQWTTSPGDRFEDGVPVRFDGFFLQNGGNTFILDVPKAGNPNPSDVTSFAWYSLEYHRFLRAVSQARGFSSVATTGMKSYAIDGFDAGTTAYVFDVTDMRAPVRLTGVEAGSQIRFAYNFSGGRRHFWATNSAGLRSPAGLEFYTPPDLRAEVTAPNMLIITDPAFMSAAMRLRSHRLGNLPYYSNPRVKVVTTHEIYDNFSGGLVDPMAIRNYIKFLYDNYHDTANNPTLGYVCLLGDATEDIRNSASSQPDFVPSNLYFTRRTPFTFVTDEWYGHLDEEDFLSGRGVLNVALGRLPAASPQEASILVDKTIAYETESSFGDWRKEIILVADDELSSNRFACDWQFTWESEKIAYDHAAEFLDVGKVYLTEYDRISNVKPASRAAFLDAWNEGALIVNYIGHGSNRQMADELVFVDSDVGLLNNGLRLPILLALSCTIGDFANYQVKSLSEKLLLRREGGVVGTVTASRETFANLNNRLNFSLFDHLTADFADGEVPAVGEAVMVSKLRALIKGFNSATQEENNWKYNLLCDPALRLQAPRRQVRFEMGATDTLVAGLRKTIRGAVYEGGAVNESFNGIVRVTVREPDDPVVYETECFSSFVMFYRIPGGVIYQGTTDVTNGRFEVSFRVPRSARRGPLAFVTAYGDNNVFDAVATLDSTLSLVDATPADSTELKPSDGPPRVVLGFKSGLTTVKPGETLQAIVRDADGINILRTTNEGRQAIVFDDLPVPFDANEFFAFDHGGADTSGVMLFPLPDLEFGDHRAIYKVSDAFGQTTLDTLLFNVTDPRDFFADVVLNYPNPFKTTTHFLVRLSDRADIRLEIFTVSGRRIRRLEESREGGEIWIEWDGRDAHGGEIANGVYLYVARVDFLDIERTPLVLRGKLSKIE